MSRWLPNDTQAQIDDCLSCPYETCINCIDDPTRAERYVHDLYLKAETRKRYQAGWSQKKIAESLGMTTTKVNKYVHGRA